MIGHDLSNCRLLQQDANVISGGEKKVYANIQQLYCSKVVGAHDGNKSSPCSVLKLEEVVVKHVLEPILKPNVEPI